MSQTEEQNRIWSKVAIERDYGYFGDFPPVKITCHSDGHLVFKVDGDHFQFPPPGIVDKEHHISKKSLQALDQIVARINDIQELAVVGQMMDGPSFACQIHLNNGRITGFHYCSQELAEKFDQLEKDLRKILREEFFLKKLRKPLGP